MALLFLPKFLRALRALRGSTDEPPPMILSIGRPKTREELEHELCASRQLAREKTRAASEALAISANLRHKLDEAEALNVEAAAKLEAYDRTVARLEKEIDWRRKANCKMAGEWRECRDALKQITDDLTEGAEILRAEQLQLVDFADSPPEMVLPAWRVGCLVRDRDGQTAGVALVSRSRRLLHRIVSTLLPPTEDVELAAEIAEKRGSETKS